MTPKTVDRIYDDPFDRVVKETIADAMPDVFNSLCSADPYRQLTRDEIIDAVHRNHPHEWEELREKVLDALVSSRIARWLSDNSF